MCGSTVDIQSPTAEIRRGTKEERKKIETTAAKYNGPIKRRFATITFIAIFHNSNQTYPTIYFAAPASYSGQVSS